MFSAGVDLKRLAAGGPGYAATLLPALSDCFARLFFHPRPVIAAVNGHAIAGGCVLACAADRRLGARGPGRIGVTELLVGVPFPALALEIMRAWRRPFLPEMIFPDGPGRADAGGGAGGVLVYTRRALGQHPVKEGAGARRPARGKLHLTKAQARQPIRDFLGLHAARIDHEVARIWSAAPAQDAIRRYVDKTLGGGRPSPGHPRARG